MAILPPTGEIIVLDKHIRNALFSIYQKSFQRFIHFSVLWHRHCHAVTSSPSSPHAAKSAQLCFRNSPCIVFCQCSSQPAPFFLLPSRCDSLTTCHCKSLLCRNFPLQREKCSPPAVGVGWLLLAKVRLAANLKQWKLKEREDDPGRWVFSMCE